MALGARVRRVFGHMVIHPEEFELAGRITGGSFVLGGLTLALMTVLPGAPHTHAAVLLALAGLATLTGPIVYYAVPWERAPQWVVHPLQALALATIGVAVAFSGGSRSPAWIYLLIFGMYAAYFYRRSVAVGYLVACVLVQSLPLLYDADATHDMFLGTLLIAAPVYVGLGLMINESKRWLWSTRARAKTVLAEQSALRRVATAVVNGGAAEEIYEMVAAEVGALLNGAGAAIVRAREDDQVEVAGAWASQPDRVYTPGTTVPLRAEGPVQRALATGSPVRSAEHVPEGALARLGYGSSVVAPIDINGRPWGLLVVGSLAKDAFQPGDEQTLLEFGSLLATAIASAEERSALAEQALSDSLTGLANPRALRQRLATELARAARHGSPLTVAVIDIDHFKAINDNAGHEVGDEMLVRVARALSSFARVEDIVARLGGDEFAWVLPDTTRDQAFAAVERARRLIASAPADPFRITISAGICDLDSATDPDELLRLADSALYWSKLQGRNQTWIYDPAVIDELTEKQRAERLERAQGLQGLRALVRTLEAGDPATRGHSERVAALAGRLAAHAGWSTETAQALAQAALLHDVGGIAAGRTGERLVLDDDGLGRLRESAAMSARLLAHVLEPEQVEWVAGQYDAGSEGGSLIALAGVWDSLTALAPGPPAEVALECQRLVGVCFSDSAVQALLELHRLGELPGGGLAGGRPVGGQS